MRRITGVRSVCQLIMRRFEGIQNRPFCDSTFNAAKGKKATTASSDGKVGRARDMDVYKDLDKLDFMKAAKILFTHPPKAKKFGIDFHLVQLFFVCLPSLAVYLVAQYARYEMRKMDAELDVKKKAEEEVKEKEAASAKEKEAQSVSELFEVKERLNSLEKAVNEIVVATKKSNPTDDSSGKNHPINNDVAEDGGSSTVK